MLSPPVEPMLAKVADELPGGGSYLYELKWMDVRSSFAGGDDVAIQSRSGSHSITLPNAAPAALLEFLPAGCVVAWEIVIQSLERTVAKPLDFRLFARQARHA